MKKQEYQSRTLEMRFWGNYQAENNGKGVFNEQNAVIARGEFELQREGETK